MRRFLHASSSDTSKSECEKDTSDYVSSPERPKPKPTAKCVVKMPTAPHKRKIEASGSSDGTRVRKKSCRASPVVARFRTSKYSDLRKRMVSGKAQVSVEVVQMDEGRFFDSWQAFEEAWDAYANQNLLHFRLRTSTKTTTHNEKLRLGKGKLDVGFHVPESSFKHVRRQYYCTHGCLDGPRGTGQRQQIHYRFTGCPARLTVLVAKRGKKIGVQITSEATTHNHHVTQEIFDKINLKKAITSEELGTSVDLLMKASVPMRNLAEYISSKIGQDVSHQQVRNFCAARYGGPSAEKRVLAILEKFAEGEDNECMVLCAEDDVVCGIAFLNAAQKAMYARWGECLLLDWTHHTNNLGFFLGELMVTAPNGKGISVFEMLVADQKMETMRACLQFFRDSVGESVTESFVIDKDFNEWRVLEDVFPAAKVLLCQFHALLAIKKKVASRNMNVAPQNRSMLEDAWHGLVYAATKEDFKRERKRMKNYCEKICPAFQTYLEKNWFPFRSMWSCHARGNYFTAGNTTSNRLEATWKQMKKLVSLTSSLDQCVAAILLYQNASMRELRADLVRRSLTTYFNPRLPGPLQKLANVTSDWVYQRIQDEFLRYEFRDERALLSVVSCTKKRVVVQDVHDENQVEFPWRSMETPTCNCSRFKELRLPCIHIIYAVVNAKKVEVIPTMSLASRWNYAEATEVVPLLKKAAKMNTELRDLVFSATKRGSQPATAEVAGSKLQFESRPRIRFTKLKTNERAAGRVVVKSDSEKFNIATALFEPLVQDLVGSSSMKFYEKLDFLTVACSDMKKALAEMDDEASAEVSSDAALFDSDDIQVAPPATPPNRYSNEGSNKNYESSSSDSDSEGIGARVGRKEFGVAEVATPGSDDCHDDVSVSNTDPRGRQPSTSIGAREFTQPVENGAGETTRCAPPAENGAGGTTHFSRDEKMETMQVSGASEPTHLYSNGEDGSSEAGGSSKVLLLRLPSVVHAGSKNNTRRQKTQMKLMQTRIAITLDMSSWTRGPKLADVTTWLQRTTNEDKAGQVLERYPRVLTGRRSTPVVFGASESSIRELSVVFSQSLAAASLQAIRRARKSSIVKPTNHGLAVKVTGSPRYHETLIYSMDDFYQCLTAFESRQNARKWLRTDWESLDPEAVERLVPPNAGIASEIAAAISRILDVTSLTSYLSIPVRGGSVSAPISEVLRAVPCSQWLTDTPIAMMMQLLCAEHGNAYFVESLCTSTVSWKIPPRLESDWDYIITPVNINNIHWTLIVAHLKTGELIIFDPMHSDAFVQKTKERWQDVMVPAIDEWRVARFKLQREQDHNATLDPMTWPEWHISIIGEAKQGDGSSCGVLVIAVTWCILHRKTDGLLGLQGKVTSAATKLLRLHVLWYLLCSPLVQVIVPAAENLNGMRATEASLREFLADEEGNM